MKKINLLFTLIFISISSILFAQIPMSCNLNSFFGPPFCANVNTGYYNLNLQLSIFPNSCVGSFGITLQRKLPSEPESAWSGFTPNVQLFPIVTNGSSYNHVAITTQLQNTTFQYRCITSFNPSAPVGTCASAPITICTTSVLTVSTLAPAKISYKINDLAVNTSTAVRACDNGPINMTSITATGNATSYTYRFGSSKNGGAIVWNAWTSGMPPISMDIKPKLVANHGAALTGDYNIYMEVNNQCGSVYQYWGKLQVISGNLSLTLKACTDINCLSGGTVISSTTSCASPLSTFCNFNPTLSASSSNISLLGGTWSCKLEEYPITCTGLPVLVFTKPSSNLNTISDLSNIPLNSYASIYGGKLFPYLTTNSASKIWKFTLTVTNNCGTVSFSCFLRNINTGCKTGTITENEIKEEFTTIENLKDGWDFFPNPANKEVTVLYDVTSETPQTIKVYDLTGKLQEVQIKEVSINESKIDISSLSKGIYIIEKSGENTTTKKLIVE